MPTYQYICKACDEGYEITCSIDQYEKKYADTPVLCDCGSKLFRRFSFSTKPGFEDHYNHSVGEYVETKRELVSKLSKLSDETSERMGGMSVKFEPISPYDAEHTVKKTDRGLEALDNTNRHRRSIGKTERKFYSDVPRPKRSVRFKPYQELDSSS